MALLPCLDTQHRLVRANGADYPVAHRCGKCKACRISYREEWVGRLILESLAHPSTAFVTLTYSPENLPVTASVSVREAQLWQKRLRQLISDNLRFFTVGEYGEKFGRPHYHALVFGMPPYLGEPIELQKSWPAGFVKQSQFTVSRARYVAKYTMKALESRKSYSDGRVSEFAIMSLRPALGHIFTAKVVAQIQDSIRTRGRSRFVDDQGRLMVNSLPNCFRHNGRLYPISRRAKLAVADAFHAEPSSQSNQSVRAMRLNETAHWNALEIAKVRYGNDVCFEVMQDYRKLWSSINRSKAA